MIKCRFEGCMPMNKNLVFFGENFSFAQSGAMGILQNIQKYEANIISIDFLSKNTLTLHAQIDRLLKSPTAFICSKSSLALLFKVICTVVGGRTKVQNNLILPEFATNVSGGFELIYRKTQSVCLVVNEQGQINESYFANKNVCFYLPLPKEDAQILIAPIALSYSVDFLVYGKAPNLSQIFLPNQAATEHNSFLSHLKKLLNNKIILQQDLSSFIIKKLVEKNLTISFAESCTGGKMASYLIETPGSSAVVKGGLIAYWDEIKKELLYVSNASLKAQGAVSKSVVDEMLKGANERFKTDFCIAISGIAGPGGAVKNKPIGTVYVGVRYQDIQIVERVQLKGSRMDIQRQSVYYALSLLLSEFDELFFRTPH